RLINLLQRRPGHSFSLRQIAVEARLAYATVRKNLRRLAADPQSGVRLRIEFGRRRPGMPTPSHHRYFYQPEVPPIPSNRFSETELTGGATKIFYTHRQFNMLDYIFSTQMRERLSKFSVRSISKADFAEVTAAEALTAYSFLQRADRRLDQSKLFTALHRQGLL